MFSWNSSVYFETRQVFFCFLLLLWFNVLLSWPVEDETWGIAWTGWRRSEITLFFSSLVSALNQFGRFFSRSVFTCGLLSFSFDPILSLFHCFILSQAMLLPDKMEPDETPVICWSYGCVNRSSNIRISFMDSMFAFCWCWHLIRYLWWPAEEGVLIMHLWTRDDAI